MPKPFSFLGRRRREAEKVKAEVSRREQSQTPQTLRTSSQVQAPRPVSPSQQVVDEGSVTVSLDNKAPLTSAIPVDQTSSESTTLPLTARNLWDEAWKELVREDPELVAKFDAIVTKASSPAATSPVPTYDHDFLKGFIAIQFDSIAQRQWHLQLGKCSVSVRSTLEKVIGIITTTKDFATQAAALDPLHAGLPVAAICLLVTV